MVQKIIYIKVCVAKLRIINLIRYIFTDYENNKIT